MSRAELKLLQTIIRDSKCESEDDVRKCVQVYFDGLSWSLLKDEWTRMGQPERDEFIKLAFRNTRK